MGETLRCQEVASRCHEVALRCYEMASRCICFAERAAASVYGGLLLVYVMVVIQRCVYRMIGK